MGLTTVLVGAMLGLIGGLPTIAGAWTGGLVYSAVLSVVFLGLGAGAIAQVALQIARQMAGTQTIAARFAQSRTDATARVLRDG